MIWIALAIGCPMTEDDVRQVANQRRLLDLDIEMATLRGEISKDRAYDVRLCIAKVDDERLVGSEVDRSALLLECGML